MDCTGSLARCQAEPMPDLGEDGKQVDCLGVLTCTAFRSPKSITEAEINAWTAFLTDSLCEGAANAVAQRLISTASGQAKLPSALQWMNADYPLYVQDYTALLEELAQLGVGELYALDLSVPKHQIEGAVLRVSQDCYSVFVANTGGRAWIYHPSRWDAEKRKIKRQAVLEFPAVSYAALCGFVRGYMETPSHERSEQDLYEKHLPKLSRQRMWHDEACFWSTPQVGGSCVGRAKLALHKALLDSDVYQRLKQTLRMQGLRAACLRLRESNPATERCQKLALGILHRLEHKQGVTEDTQRLHSQLAAVLERKNEALQAQELERCGYAAATGSLGAALERFTQEMLRRHYPQARAAMHEAYTLHEAGESLPAAQCLSLYRFVTGGYWPNNPSLDEVDLHLAALWLISETLDEGDGHIYWDLDVYGCETQHRYLQLAAYQYFADSPWQQRALAEPQHFLHERIFMSPELAARCYWSPQAPYPLPKDPADRQALLELALVWFRMNCGGMQLMGAHYGLKDSLGLMYLERLDLSLALTPAEEVAVRQLVERVARELQQYGRPTWMSVSDCLMGYHLQRLCYRLELDLPRREQSCLDEAAQLYQSRRYAIYFGS